ncbi:SOS response-associated peptidase [Chenggangzhangella methanolivorans]|uniref:Abasic site processing protein n=1 Tax=Chenggangzhangella methanolivorans TaxID=1437009 RepID=A0A9E6UQH0_9HYPH|nr:SOS response-associated peptidase [Chenggangzhangella methanolivorans]
MPADAWYEWKTLGRFKQPYLIRRADRALVTFAAVGRRDPGRRPEVRALAIVTTAAGADVSGIHDRMPAVVAPEHRDAWLDAPGRRAASRCGAWSLRRPEPSRRSRSAR